ncbi:hypothetical protein RM190_06780 [Paracoccus sp. CPCC 101403]|uniref:NnrU domain-containing protein n=1 Tax=Paracoccus broussonetiae TaxID=3075834 RepID=A0ABU3EBH5_9RHOB|nr:hypothetical protein [Paracoccus sp. CPCC 101403]
MALVWAVVIFVALGHLWIGYRRAAMRSWRQLGAALAVLLAGALVCQLIGEGKTGGYLAGIIGFMMMLLLLIAAGSLALGGLIRLGLEAAGRPRLTVVALPWWDLAVVGTFAALAIGFSAAE